MEHIHDKLLERLDIGMERYGHGLRVDDDTTSWGTRENSWMEMMREELIDAVIYATADYIRRARSQNKCLGRKEFAPTQNYIQGDNKLIMKIINDISSVKSEKHKVLLGKLLDMLSSDISQV